MSNVDLSIGSPLPVKDTLTTNGTGAAITRTSSHLISKLQLLSNDKDWDSAAADLHITAVMEAKGGTVSLTASGDVLFTPDPSYTGVMGFKYQVADAQNNTTQVSIGTGATAQTAPMKAAVFLASADLQDSQGRIDPMLVQQWYLADSNVLAVWKDYSGKGVRIGQFEPNGPFATGPEVFDYRNSELAPNADKQWLNAVGADDPSIPQSFSNHATMVAGVMVAARNGEGGVGVAYDASLAGYSTLGTVATNLAGQITQNFGPLGLWSTFDVVNNSWGFTSASTGGRYVQWEPSFESDAKNAAQYGRGGLGTTIVNAAGNSRAVGANTSDTQIGSHRFAVNVGSINAPGDLGTLQLGQKPFSNPGANILVSAAGSNIDSTGVEGVNADGQVFGDTQQNSQGTSFAAPIVSGIVALMLQANPSLGYRDIQTILAMTARKFEDPNGTDWAYNTAKNWNGGGMHTSHDFGFGKVDALAAVRLAETWTQTSTLTNEQSKTASSATLNVAIPDGAGSVSQTLTMASGLTVETAQVTLELTHARWGDLVIKLISPSGTESVLVNRPGKAPGSAATDTGDQSSGTISFSFDTTHVRGESSAGNWTLQVFDAATGATGTLKNWKLDLFGSNTSSDDVYVYTNEFASTTGRTALTDSNGGYDTLNAAAVTTSSTINLNAGTTSTIAGKALTLDGNIEDAFGGDGDDTLLGNSATNRLFGERGNDVISAGAGDDIVDGGLGNDTLTGGAGTDYFLVDRGVTQTDTVTDFVVGVDRLVLIGKGAEPVITQEGANTRVSLGNGQSIVLQGVSSSTLAASSVLQLDSMPLGVRKQSVTLGSNASDVIYGTTGSEHMVGGEVMIFLLVTPPIPGQGAMMISTGAMAMTRS